MAAADYRLLTEATGQRIAAALESLVNLGDPVTIAHGGTGASTAAAALLALGGVAVTDIVNSLTSTATNKPLSAAQGKALNDTLPYTPFLTKQVDIGADVAMLEAGVYLFDGLATDYVNLPDQYASNSIIVVLYAAGNRKNYICISHNSHKMYFGLQWGTNITWYET